jgi:RND family efflux transporter MFP subunit
MSKMNLVRLLASAMALLLAAVSMGCGKAKDAESAGSHAPDSVVHVPAAAVGAGEIRIDVVLLRSLADTLAVSGEIQANPLKVAHVSARVSGTVQSITVVAGDRVHQGQILATLYSPEFLAAQSDFLLAHERAERAKLAGNTDAGALQSIAQSSGHRLEVLGAAATDLEALHRSHEPIPYLPLRSPIAGVLTEVEAAAGKQVTAGTDLFGTSDLSEVWAVVDAYERDIGTLSVGQPAEIIATAYPGRRFAGRLSSLEGAMREETRTLSVRLRVDNPGLALKPGMFVTARIATGRTRQALVISEAGVQELGDRKVVFVALSDSEFVARPVEVRPLGGDLVEITSGVRPGERVAVHGAFLIKSQALKGELGEE